MQTITKVASLIAINLVVVPCLLYFTGSLELGSVKTLAFVGTIAWFIATPFWMSREIPVDATHVEI